MNDDDGDSTDRDSTPTDRDATPTDHDAAPTDRDAAPTDRDSACFEAGIKFGALYHQFAGTPVSPDSAPSLETAMEEAIENQPFCEAVTVEILTERLDAEIDHGYTELSGHLMEVEIVVEREGVEVVTRMEMEDGYPLMQVESLRQL